MAESPSDFIDFNAWKDLTGQAEAELMQRQQGEAETQTAEAQRLLNLSEQRASGDRYRGNLGATAQQQGSYADYLKAKKSAETARAALASRSGLQGSVRGALNAEGGYSGAQSAADRLAQQEVNVGAREAGSIAGMTASKAQSDARIAAEKKAREERAAEDAARKKAYLEQVFGTFGKFASGENSRTGLTGSDRTRMAQQLSQGVDEGTFQLPERNIGPGMPRYDYRGGTIENAAWGTGIKATGGATTKKGKAY
jgi:hypothetical protein